MCVWFVVRSTVVLSTWLVPVRTLPTGAGMVPYIMFLAKPNKIDTVLGACDDVSEWRQRKHNSASRKPQSAIIVV